MVGTVAVNQCLCKYQKFDFDARNPPKFSAYIQSSFFTSIDSVLFSLASNKDKGNTTSRVMLASLVGALVFHAAAGM